MYFLLILWSFYGPQVLKESFKIYCSINDGIINLVDMVLLTILLDVILRLCMPIINL